MNETGRPGRTPLLLARSVPFLLLAMLYRGVPWQGFKADDFLFLRNLSGRGLLEAARRAITEPFLELHSLGLYRPLQSLSLALDHAVFGLDPRGFYADHLAWMAVVLGLFLLAATRLRLGPAATLLAAVGFVLHPLHPNVTAWISSRSYLFLEASLFGILVLLPREDRSPGTRPLEAWGLGAVALAGALSHEIGLFLPFLAAAGVLVMAPPSRSLPRLLAAAAPCGLAVVIALMLRVHATGLLPWSPRPDVQALSAAAPAFSWRTAAAGLAALVLPARSHASGFLDPRLLLLIPAAAAMVLGPLARPLRRREIAMAAFLLAAILLPALLPVSHGQPAPISGRHWFLATGPLALLWALLAMRPRGIPLARPSLDRFRGILAALGAGAVAMLFAPEQARSLAIHADAGKLAREVQASLEGETRGIDPRAVVVFFEPPMTLGDPPTAAPLPWSLGMLLDPPFGPARPRPTILPAPLLPGNRAEALGLLLEPTREVHYLRYFAGKDGAAPHVRVVERRFAHQVASRLVEEAAADLSHTRPQGHGPPARGTSPLHLDLRVRSEIPSPLPSTRQSGEGIGPEEGWIHLVVTGCPPGTSSELVLASEVGARRFPFHGHPPLREREAVGEGETTLEALVPRARLADEVRLFGVREAFAYAESMNPAGRVVARSSAVVLDLLGLGLGGDSAGGALGEGR